MSYRNKFLVILVSTVLVFYSVVGGLLGRDGGGEGYAPLNVFMEVLSKIQGVYVEDPNLSKVMHGALLGLLESLDPYSTYLTAEEYRRYRKTRTSGDGDIGLDLSKERSLGYIRVIHPIEGSAAAESGVKPGDIIESIDGVTTRNIGLVQAGYLLSGDVGSKVELKIRRLGRSEPVLMSVSRERSRPPSVRGRLLKDDIGYLRIPRFAEGVSAATREQLKSLEAQGARKFVLDLRNCGGEAFEEGVGVANLFLDHGVIAYSEGQQSPRKEFVADPGKLASKLPLAVLQNLGSASAAEIVSVAIKENRRGDIVGVRSFGKASVQKLFALPGGAAVLLSVSKYYSQSGQVIQARGVAPDHEVTGASVHPASGEAPDGSDSGPKEEDLQLKKAIEILNSPAAPTREAA
ncbi:MAG: S41 family peptidase [Acidobacteria bacterium]|nr:S41 family peptidase [Acidobacteriota bacterium]